MTIGKRYSSDQNSLFLSSLINYNSNMKKTDIDFLKRYDYVCATEEHIR